MSTCEDENWDRQRGGGRAAVVACQVSPQTQRTHSHNAERAGVGIYVHVGTIVKITFTYFVHLNIY